MQIAALTEKIRYMTEHLRTHHKDKVHRGLVAMLERRKKLLRYLRKSDGDAYGEVIYRLGLKDRSFVEDKYKTSKSEGLKPRVLGVTERKSKKAKLRPASVVSIVYLAPAQLAVVLMEPSDAWSQVAHDTRPRPSSPRAPSHQIERERRARRRPDWSVSTATN